MSDDYEGDSGDGYIQKRTTMPPGDPPLPEKP